MSLIATAPPAATEAALALVAPQIPAYTVTITPEALSARSDALIMSGEIVAVKTAKDRDDALVAGGLLKGLIKQMEDTKAIVKRPVLDAGNAIEEAAKGYSGALKIELARVEKLVSDYTAAERQRIEALRQEELRDMESAASTATTEQLRDMAARTAELNQPVEIAGARVDTFTDYEVMDVLELAKARPDLVKIEPRRRELLAYLSIPNHAKLPGICEFPACRTHAKAII